MARCDPWPAGPGQRSRIARDGHLHVFDRYTGTYFIETVKIMARAESATSFHVKMFIKSKYLINFVLLHMFKCLLLYVFTFGCIIS